MPDSSTTTTLILDLIAGGCWAQRQLRSSIMDVTIISQLMKSLTLVGVVFIGILTIPELDGRFLHDHWTNHGSDCEVLLSSTPASQSYKIHPSANCIYEVTRLNIEKCWQSQNSMADFSTATALMLDLITGGSWARRKLHIGIGYIIVTSVLMKSLKLLRVVFIIVGTVGLLMGQR